MTTVHLIFNAHIDPVWLWPWQSGMDETLATCRTACDLLDEYPDFIFTKGEAWSYKLMETLDPGLFSRIKAHVESGRWEITGGWWIQPDCNLPSGFAMERQIGIGKDYLTRTFGSFPNVAYNVDSFGHASALPGYMRAAGQDYYIMMRPQEHEMDLPARIFRWRGYEDGPEVVAFRIARAYTAKEASREHIMAALEALPPGVSDTMCFLGVGDHGGGATAGLINWCLENANAFEGIRLEFSSPARFFNRIAGLRESLPLVVGELQHHAIGCYTVRHDMKTALRRAEHMIEQAGTFHGLYPEALPGEDIPGRLQRAWERVCFNQFHDTLGGTSIPSAYVQAAEQLGSATADAEEALYMGLRVLTSRLPDEKQQRIVLFNASDTPYSGPVEVEPWTEYRPWEPSWKLLDEDAKTIPVQLIHGESAMGIWYKRLHFKVGVEPGGMRVLRIDTDGGDSEGLVPVEASDCTPPGGFTFESLELQLIPDTTDNWSHGIDRYPEEPQALAVWKDAVQVDKGPIMWSTIRTGSIGKSTLTAEWRTFPGEDFADLHLRVHWLDEHAVMKLTVPFDSEPVSRMDGVMGGWLERPLSGVERPLQDSVRFMFPDGTSLGIVSPDIFGLDADGDRVRLTLLRNPIATHHDPIVPDHPRAVFTDMGIHEFTIRFFRGNMGTDLPHMHSNMLHRPLVKADVTKGMPRFKGM